MRKGKVDMLRKSLVSIVLFLAPVTFSTIADATTYNPPAQDVRATQVCGAKAAGSPADVCQYFNVLITWKAPKNVTGITGYQLFFNKMAQTMSPVTPGVTTPTVMMNAPYELGNVHTFTVTHVSVGSYSINVSARGTKGVSSPGAGGAAVITVRPMG